MRLDLDVTRPPKGSSSSEQRLLPEEGQDALRAQARWWLGEGPMGGKAVTVFAIWWHPPPRSIGGGYGPVGIGRFRAELALYGLLPCERDVILGHPSGQKPEATLRHGGSAS